MTVVESVRYAQPEMHIACIILAWTNNIYIYIIIDKDTAETRREINIIVLNGTLCGYFSPPTVNETFKWLLSLFIFMDTILVVAM